MALYPINAQKYVKDLCKFAPNILQSLDSLGRAQSVWWMNVNAYGGIDNADVDTTFYNYQRSFGNTDGFVFILRYKYNANDQYYTYMLVKGKGNGKTGGTVESITASKSVYFSANYTELSQLENVVYKDWDYSDATVTFNYNITETSEIKNSGLYSDFISKLNGYRLIRENIGDDSPILNNEPHYFYLPKNVPLFDAMNPDAIIAYINSGDTSGAIKKYSTDWTLYVDGDTKPLLKLTWKCETLEDLATENKIDLNDVYINVFTVKNDERVYLSTLPYTDGHYNTSYADILQKGDPESYAELVENLFVPTTVTAGVLRFEILIENGKSAICYALIPIKGEVKYYGILQGEEDDGSTVTIIYGSGAEDDGYITPEEPSDVDDETKSNDGYSSLGLLTTTYALTNARLQALGAFMWGGLLDSLKLVNNNPIENIVSCKIIPHLLTGTTKEIVLGNVDTGVNGDVVSNNVKITIGSIAVNEYYNSFLDFAPYTKLTLFLPFIGFKELDTSLFMGKTLKIEYVIDLITGTCKALLFANDIYCQSFDGSCGIDIPITANNRAQVEASYITGALGAIGELVSGDIGGAISGALSTAKTQYHYNTQGSYNPSCGAFETRLCYLIFDRPTFQKPSSYSHDIGNPCQLTSQLSSLKGFTKCSNSIDLSGVQCTQDERTEIYNLLTSGVYL